MDIRQRNWASLLSRLMAPPVKRFFVQWCTAGHAEWISLVPEVDRTLPQRETPATLPVEKLTWKAGTVTPLRNLPQFQDVDSDFARPNHSHCPFFNLLILSVLFNPSEEAPSQIIVQSEMMPNIIEFRTSDLQTRNPPC